MLATPAWQVTGVNIIHFDKMSPSYPLRLSIPVLGIVCFLLCFACGKEQANIMEIPVSFDNSGINVPFRWSQCIDTVFTITVSDKEGFVNPGNDIKYSNGIYYLVDCHDDSLIGIDTSGAVVLRISCRGRAPGEYVSLTKYDINPLSGQITIYDEAADRLLIYSCEGVYERTIQLNGAYEWYWDFASLEDGGYLCYMPDTVFYIDEQHKPKRGLWHIDSTGNFLSYLLTFEKDYRFLQIRSSPSFCRLGDGTIALLGEDDTNSLFLISKDGHSIEEFCHFVFDRKISSSVLKQEAKDVYGKQYFHFKYWYLDTDRWLFMKAIESTANQSTVIYDKKEKKEYLATSPSDLIDDTNIGNLGVSGSHDRMMTFDFDPEGRPEITVFVLKQ